MATQIKVNGKTTFITPTGFKLGSKGKVVPAGNFLGTLTKSEARKLRKTAHANGFKQHAAAVRIAA